VTRRTRAHAETVAEDAPRLPDVTRLIRKRPSCGERPPPGIKWLSFSQARAAGLVLSTADLYEREIQRCENALEVERSFRRRHLINKNLRNTIAKLERIRRPVARASIASPPPVESRPTRKRKRATVPEEERAVRRRS